MSTKNQQGIVINQPLEKVFAYIADSKNNPQWMPGIKELRVAPEGPTQVGTQVREVRTFIGRKMESIQEITELEPNKRKSFKSVSGPFPYQCSMTFESLGDATKLTVEAEIEAQGVFKLAEGLLASGMKKDMEASLTRAKQVLESQA